MRDRGSTDPAQFVFLIGILAGLAYFTFKLVRIWQQSDSVYQNLSLSLTVFDALSIVTLAACGIWAVWVGSGFGKGLKQAGESRYLAPRTQRGG